MNIYLKGGQRRSEGTNVRNENEQSLSEVLVVVKVGLVLIAIVGGLFLGCIINHYVGISRTFESGQTPQDTTQVTMGGALAQCEVNRTIGKERGEIKKSRRELFEDEWKKGMHPLYGAQNLVRYLSETDPLARDQYWEENLKNAKWNLSEIDRLENEKNLREKY